MHIIFPKLLCLCSKHKHLLDKETLKAGSGYGIEYTNLIRGASLDWYEHNNNQEKGK